MPTGLEVGEVNRRGGPAGSAVADESGPELSGGSAVSVLCSPGCEDIPA